LMLPEILGFVLRTPNEELESKSFGGGSQRGTYVGVGDGVLISYFIQKLWSSSPSGASP